MIQWSIAALSCGEGSLANFSIFSNSYIYMFSSGCLQNVSLVVCIHVCRAKTFLESSRCRTPPLETSVYRPRLTCSWYTLGIDVSSESTVQLKQKTGNRVKTRGGGLGSRPKKMYGERLGDGVEYHSMKTTTRR